MYLFKKPTFVLSDHSNEHCMSNFDKSKVINKKSTENNTSERSFYSCFICN